MKTTKQAVKSSLVGPNGEKQTVKDPKTGKETAVRVTVAEVDVPEYETFEELVASVDQKTILDTFNVQNGTNIMNAARAQATKGPTGEQIEAEAFSSITTEEFMACAGDPAKLKVLVDAKKELAKEKLSKRSVSMSSTSEE